MAERHELPWVLANMEVSVRPGPWCVVHGDHDLADRTPAATIRETEGVTHVLAASDADALGIEVDFRAAWLTLEVETDLEMVGLTAVVAQALAHAGIPCNVLAGFHHDHLLVPEERAGSAVAVLMALRDQPAQR